MLRTVTIFILPNVSRHTIVNAPSWGSLPTIVYEFGIYAILIVPRIPLSWISSILNPYNESEITIKGYLDISKKLGTRSIYWGSVNEENLQIMICPMMSNTSIWQLSRSIIIRLLFFYTNSKSAIPHVVDL